MGMPKAGIVARCVDSIISSPTLGQIQTQQDQQPTSNSQIAYCHIANGLEAIQYEVLKMIYLHINKFAKEIRRIRLDHCNFKVHVRHNDPIAQLI